MALRSTSQGLYDRLISKRRLDDLRSPMWFVESDISSARRVSKNVGRSQPKYAGDIEMHGSLENYQKKMHHHEFALLMNFSRL
jgi:hypothetical protein